MRLELLSTSGWILFFIVLTLALWVVQTTIVLAAMKHPSRSPVFGDALIFAGLLAAGLARLLWLVTP